MPATPTDRPADRLGRPVKRRGAARVVIVADDTVLLQGDTDPGVPGSRFWQTPGGGIDPEETPLSAAIREVYEETGLVVAARDVRGPVGTRVVAHGYSDRILLQHETFYLLRAERFDPVPAALTAREAERRVDALVSARRPAGEHLARRARDDCCVGRRGDARPRQRRGVDRPGARAAVSRSVSRPRGAGRTPS